MESVEKDLARVMDGMTGGFTEWEAKHIMRQLLEGVAFLHENGIMHGNLKPSNLLLSNNGELKVCDFGFLKRRFDGHSHQLGSSLWYIAPELLTGEDQRYSRAIDTWSVGCIMAELLQNQVLFQGSSKTDQLQKITDIMGNRKRLLLWPLLDRKFADVLSRKGIDLLKKLLTCDPDSRITADQALNHQWFT